MRYRMYLGAIALSLVLLFGSLPVFQGSEAQADVQINFSFFHNSLSPHGNWVVIGNYGPCWRPANLSAGWQPYYTNGYWAYTEYGWTWISNESWGRIVYHYGTWYYDSYYGWVWVPGYVWAPAWVTWSYTDDYIGWAPLPPTFYFSFGYRPGYAGYGYYGRPIVVNHNHYVFVPCRRFTENNINMIRVPVEENVKIVRRARSSTTIGVINHHVVNHGPELTVVEQFKRSPKRFEQISGEIQIKPQPIRVAREETRIEIVSPKLNRKEAELVIKDLDRQERSARADRERQISQDREERRVLREQKEQQQDLQRRQEREKIKVERDQKLQQEREQRRIELDRRDQQDKLQREQERQLRDQQRIERRQEQIQRQPQQERRIEKEQRRGQEKQKGRKG
jgi:hypothetical protein